MDLPLKRKDRERNDNGEGGEQENEPVKKKCDGGSEGENTGDVGKEVETTVELEEEFDLIEYLKSNEDDEENVSSQDSNDEDEDDSDEEEEEEEEDDDEN